MQTRTRFFPAALSLALAVVVLPAPFVSRADASSDETRAVSAATATQQAGALERGYRTGYSDGYQAGYRDSIERAARDYRNKEEYGRADRAYVAAYGALEDYRDGYQQGFEVGYEAGFDRRGFDSIIPPGLSRRGAAAQGAQSDAGAQPVNDARPTYDTTPDARVSDSNNRNSGGPVRQIGSLDIPMDTTMRVELLTNLSTDATQRGDRFEARVIEPAAYEGAQVTGRVKGVKRGGKVRGTAELQLDFEQISLPDGRFTNFNAQIVEVVGRSAGNVGDVDEEGGVRGKSTTKDDVAKVGSGAGIGAIIGAIAGGGKGAAIGAVIGGGIGAGGVVTSRAKDVRLERGQELMIRTSTETRIQ
ncbi:MAG: hypothetical protein LC803_15930 [Acidobacteria bacterium]|nr:hypothetical protein [Acidobacteriota bacterium]